LRTRETICGIRRYIRINSPKRLTLRQGLRLFKHHSMVLDAEGAVPDVIPPGPGYD
jgi:hypothetical protein